MITLKKTDVLELHKLIIQEHGGSHGVRDEGLLESAVYLPYMTFDGVDLYPSIEAKAAQLCFGLVKSLARSETSREDLTAWINAHIAEE